MLKRSMVIFIILFMSFITIGAAVSDNDGSAFITKAEFDSLKIEFQSQLNQYNVSIDNKIDNAIASYLTSLNISSEVKTSIIMKNWSDVTCYNGSFAPTYDLPSVNIGLTYIHCWPKSMQAVSRRSNRNGWWNISLMFTYSNPGTNNIYRPLVTGNTETNQTTNMVWSGIAYKYMEYWNMSKTNMQTNGDWLMWLDGPTTYDYGGTLRNTLRFSPSGYYSSPASILATWSPTLFWKYREKSSTGDWNTQNITINSSNDKFSVCVFDVVLGKSGNDTTFHNHIIEYDGNKKWTVSNKDFTSTFRLASSVDSSDLFNATTKTGLTANWGLLTNTTNTTSGGWTRTYDDQRFSPIDSNSYYNCGGSSSTPDIEDASATTLPCIGMLSADQDANDIYQFNDNIIVTFKGKTTTLSKQTLEKGFPLFYVDKDLEVSWEPVFEKYYKNDGSGWVEQNDKIKLYLSYGPFSDLTTTTKPVEFTTKNYSTKSTSQVLDLTGDKVSFKSTEDGIIFAKWVPNTTNFATDTWYSTLKLANCNQYKYVEER